MALLESIPLKKDSYYNPNWLTQAESNSFFLTIVLLGGAPIKTKNFSIPTTTLTVGSSCLDFFIGT